MNESALRVNVPVQKMRKPEGAMMEIDDVNDVR